MAEQNQQQAIMSTKVNQYFSAYPLYANETPVFRAVNNCPFIPCGKSNNYPDYLAYLYNNSVIHSAIVQGKAKYIFGKGFKVKKDWTGNVAKLEQLMKSINGYQTLDELEKKAIFENALYGGKYYMVQWGALGKPISITLQPFNTVRTNEDCTKFFVSKNWTKEMSTKSKWKNVGTGKLPEDAIEYKAFNKLKPTGKQILFIKDDNPASDIYPLPEYEPCKTSIETEIECGYFHLNNVKSGFAAGTMVTFYNGGGADEAAQEEIDSAFKNKFIGTDNAGEIILNFQDPGTTPPAVNPLRSNELDKQFEQLSKDVINKTLQGHRVSNGLLFGIKTPGELGGGRSEFDLAWEHFCNTYVKPKQQDEAADVNYILSLYGFVGEPLELVVLDPIGIELTAETILKVLDSDSLSDLVYDKLGIDKPVMIKNDDILTTINSASPLVANKILDSLTPNEIRSIIKLGPIAGGEVITPPTTPAFKKMFAKFEEDTILSKFRTIGESADLFDIIQVLGKYEPQDFATQTKDEKIIDILSKNKKITIKNLAGLMDMSEDKVYKILDRLNASNKVAVKYVDKGGKVVVEVEEVQPPKDVELMTKWRYAGPKDSKNRPFCAEMLGMNKLFTRSEIDSLNNDMDDFNTDVWTYKGGWYHDPVRDVNVPQCRHYFEGVVVKKK